MTLPMSSYIVSSFILLTVLLNCELLFSLKYSEKTNQEIDESNDELPKSHIYAPLFFFETLTTSAGIQMLKRDGDVDCLDENHLLIAATIGEMYKRIQIMKDVFNVILISSRDTAEYYFSNNSTQVNMYAYHYDLLLKRIQSRPNLNSIFQVERENVRRGGLPTVQEGDIPIGDPDETWYGMLEQMLRNEKLRKLYINTRFALHIRKGLSSSRDDAEIYEHVLIAHAVEYLSYKPVVNETVQNYYLEAMEKSTQEFQDAKDNPSNSDIDRVLFFEISNAFKDKKLNHMLTLLKRALKKRDMSGKDKENDSS